MDCYIVCNMFPPQYSNVVRAPGLRAQQLAEQAKPHFTRVRYIMLKSRYNMLLKSPAVYQGIKSDPDFLVIHDSYLNAFLSRIDTSVFVVSQLEMNKVANLASQRHVLIYDMLASKGLELTCGGAADNVIEMFARRQKQFIAQSNRILVNGPKLYDLEASSLEPIKSKVVDNPFCLVPGADQEDARRDRILFFAAAQRWTDNSAFLATMADYLEQNPQTQAYFMSSLKPHEDPESVSISRLAQMPHVRRIGNLSYPAYLEVLSRCYAVMDWSIVNEERRYSTSTRLIQAVSRGAAVFGNAETGLANYWGGYPGMTSDERPSVDQLGSFIDTARKGGFAADLTRAQKWNQDVLSNKDVFGGLQ